MAFSQNNFSPVGGSSGISITGFSVYAYRTDDDFSMTGVTGYFNFLRDMLFPNDLIIISGKLNDSDPDSRQFYILSVLTAPPSEQGALDVTVKLKSIAAA